MANKTHSRDCRTLLRAKASLGEGPVWDPCRRVIWWVDINAHLIHRTSLETGEDQTIKAKQVVGCVAICESGRLLVARKDDLAWVDPDTGKVEPFYTLEEDKPHCRFNDGKCDPAGRFWFGSIDTTRKEKNAAFYMFDLGSGTVTQKETNITNSNGLGWSPDDKTMYYTDTPDNCIYAYDFDLEKGILSNKRVHIDLKDEKGFPDGLTVDSEGFIWSAQWDGSCILRISPEGKVVERIPVPVLRPTSCTFAGEDLDQLVVTSSGAGLEIDEDATNVQNGDLFVIETDTKGQPTNWVNDVSSRSL